MRATSVTAISKKRNVYPIGMSLLLSYDIVKAHGEVPIAIGMKVETKEGEGSEFVIQLPISI